MIDREIKEERFMKDNPKLVEVLLSKERTLLARESATISLAQLALGIAAFGFLIIRFFADASYEWFLAIGVGFVIISGWLFLHAFREYTHLQKKLENLHQRRGHLDVLYVTEELEHRVQGAVKEAVEGVVQEKNAQEVKEAVHEAVKEAVESAVKEEAKK